MRQRLLRLALLTAALAPAAAWSQPERTHLANLTDLSLEQLANITVTSASGARRAWWGPRPRST
jgi:hypothetical protein